MFDKKNNTYTFCKRELIQTLLNLADSQSVDNQACLLCSAKILAEIMPAVDTISIEVQRRG